jgi:hypothetical protein
VVNYFTIRIIFTLIVMANFWTEIVDVRGAFLTAEFEPNHRMFVSVPKGFEKNFPESVVLLLKKTLYGTCQAPIQFWKKLCVVVTVLPVESRRASRLLELGGRHSNCWQEGQCVAGKNGIG